MAAGCDKQKRVAGNEARGGRPRGGAAPIDAHAVEVAQQIIRALAETPLAARDLARVVNRTAPATSQHIRVLRDAGAIESTRSGNSR